MVLVVKDHRRVEEGFCQVEGEEIGALDKAGSSVDQQYLVGIELELRCRVDGSKDFARPRMTI